MSKIKDTDYIFTYKCVEEKKKEKIIRVEEKKKKEKRIRLSAQERKEKQKQYYMENKEQKCEYQRQYHEKNKERISDSKKQKIKCECGCEVRKDDLNRHRQTPKHKNLTENKSAYYLLLKLCVMLYHLKCFRANALPASAAFKPLPTAPNTGANSGATIEAAVSAGAATELT
jgi:Fe2+ transport system protein B